MPQTRIIYFISKRGENPVRKFIESLSFTQKSKIFRIFRVIVDYGIISANPHLKKLKSTPFWEIRILGKDNIRIFYIVPRINQVLLIHGFVKKTQRTSKKELSTALERYEELCKTTP